MVSSSSSPDTWPSWKRSRKLQQEFCLEVPEAVREGGRLTDIDSVDIHETEPVEVGCEVCAHSGAIEIDFSQPIFERLQERDHGSA
jgi:hypothetical protein